jgi:hypothetical protein
MQILRPTLRFYKMLWFIYNVIKSTMHGTNYDLRKFLRPVKTASNFFIDNHPYINVRSACGSRVSPVVTYFIKELNTDLNICFFTKFSLRLWIVALSFLRGSVESQ